MIEVVEINLTKLLKNGLNINEYLTLVKLQLLSQSQTLPFQSSKLWLKSLIDKGYLSGFEDTIAFTEKGVKLFNSTSNNIGEKEFEEFYFIYPSKTPNGRNLRATKKEVMGRLTRDYEALLTKYTKTVKSFENHITVIEATKNMLYDYKRRGSLEFLPKLETYINQRGWERYVGLSPIEIAGENVERL